MSAHHGGTKPALLCSAQWLHANLADPTVKIVEVSMDPDSASYQSGHVPGAQFAYWKELLWHPTDRRFPSRPTMVDQLRRRGIQGEDLLVLYGDPVQFGTYAYWVLEMLDAHERLTLLDGGKVHWVHLGLPLSTAQEVPTAGDGGSASKPRRDDADRPSYLVDRTDVLNNLTSDQRILLDLRSPEEYAGERVSPPSMGFDHGAERPGRIPGARHLPHEDLLRADQTFRPPEDLARLLGEVGASPDREVVTYCRLSHRASLGWFVMRHLLGYEDVRVYDGSWTEWGSMMDMPVER